MTKSNQSWLDNPTGKIPKGSLCNCCGRYNSRDVTVHALAITDNQILLIKRAQNPMKDWWALPAGYIDWNETLEEACLRELKEETNLEGQILKLTGLYSNSDRDEDGRQNIAISYLVKVTGELKPGDDASAVAWFDLNKLPDQIAFDHRQMIEDAKRLI